MTVDYPFKLTLESNETMTIGSLEAFQTALDMAVPNRVVDFVFPLDLTDRDGATRQMADNTELGINFASCVPSTGWTESVDSEGIIPAFLLENCFELVYPVNLEDEDGNEITIEDIDTFFDLIYQCEGISPPVSGNGIVVQGFGCNELLYPFDVQTEDGSIVTVNNAEEYANLILDGEEVELQYPFSLLNADGETLVITSMDDLLAALTACGFEIQITPMEGCGFTPAHILLFFN